MESIFTLMDYWNLYRLARIRNRSKENYFEFQKFQGELLVRYLNYNKIEIKGVKLLDLACGLGGYTQALSDAGGIVTGLDINLHKSGNDFSFLIADAMKTPFGSQGFDMVICASLIEHVQNPKNLILELIRLVKPKGYIYISFPPFYSINGGHQFSPFHYLGEKVSIKLTGWRERLLRRNWYTKLSYDKGTSFENAFGNWGLYPLTIKDTTEIINELPVELINRSTRWLPVDFSGIPYLGEIITWHVQFLLQTSA